MLFSRIAPIKIENLVLYFLCVFSTSAYAADTKPICNPPPPISVSALIELPAQIQDFLLHDGPNGRGTADIGEKYNATDVIDDDAAPRQRFMSALLGSDCVQVTIERGGRGYSISILTFQKDGDSWRHTLTQAGHRDY